MAIKKFKVMASNAKKKAKSDGSCIPKSMRKDVKSGCTKKSVKASDTAKKFRVDIYKKDNPDALVKREVKTFNSEDEAKKYGESIANGGIVNVIEVKASRTKKSVKASSDVEFADMLNSVKYHLTFNKGADLIFDNRVVSSNKRNIGQLLDKYKVDDVVVDVYRDNAGKRDLQRMQDVGFEIQEEFLGENPSNSELPPHDFYHMVRNKNSVKSSKSLTVPKSKRKSVKASKTVAKSVKKFGVKASATAKRIAKSRITASMPDLEDIVMYFNGKKIYEGDGSGLTSAVEKLCENDSIKDKFVEWCNQFGDPIAFESGDAHDTAFAFAWLVDTFRYEDLDKFYADGDGILNFEIFNKSDEVKGAKSIKAGINAPDTEGPLCVCEYCLEAIESHEGRQVVYDEISEFDIEPEDKLICDWCEEEADRLYQISPDEVNSAKSIKCTQGDFTDDFSEDEFPFRVTSYYDHSQRGIADGASFDDMDEAVAYAHEKLSEGPVRIEHYDVGAVDINPDEYWENFDGEFWCTPELAEWRDEVWKSMGIGASKDIKCNDGIAPDDYDSVEDLVPEAYALSGGEDDDMLEYVDDYIATEGCPATVNFVTYNTPNDWSVDVSKYGEAVVSDFIWYLEEVASELSDKFYDYPSYEDDTTRDAFKGTKYEEGGKYATFYGDGALIANDYEFQFYPAQNQWSAPQIEFDTDGLKLIGFTDDEIDKLMQIYEDYKTAWIENCKYINAHIDEFLADLESNVNASMNIKAGITVGQDDRYDFSNPIYELDDYVKAIADGVVNQIQGITYDISKETIAFFDDDNNVVFVQPIGGIIPEPDDLETDIDELSAAIKSEMDNAYARVNWESDEDDSDYASRAVELSEDIGEVDIDDLEPITGDGDDEDIDYDFGFDSNGEALDESTVEELYRIAEYEILPKSELAKIDEYVSIDEDSWDFYMSSPHVTEKFYIHFKLTEKDIDFNKYALPEATAFPDFNYYTAVLDFDIYTENGEVTSVVLEEVKINRPDGAFDDYDVKRFDKLYNVDAIINYVESLAADTVMDIYNGTTNL